MDEVLDGLGHLWATLTSGQLQLVLEWCRVARIHIGAGDGESVETTGYRLQFAYPRKNTDTEFSHVLWSTDTVHTRRKRQE